MGNYLNPGNSGFAGIKKYCLCGQVRSDQPGQPDHRHTETSDLRQPPPAFRKIICRPDLQRKYMEFLCSLFKNSGMTSKIFAAVYMTGIFPIMKDGSQFGNESPPQ